MLKKTTSILLTIICFTSLAACSQQSTNENEASNPVSTSQTSILQQDSYYPLRFTIYDNTGNEVQQTVNEEPKRIVVIGQGFAELMIHFGEKDRIVGLAYLDNSYSKYEEKVRQLPLITDMWPSKESIIALKPDLIVAMSSAFTDERLGDISFWNERGIPVLSGINYTRGRTIESFFDDINNLGAVLNISDKTDTFIEDQKMRIKAIQDKVSQATNKPRVLLFAGGQNDTYYYYGPTLCVIDEMVEGAGGEYIKVSKDTYVEMSAESILSINPDKIIVTEFQKSDSHVAKHLLLDNSSLKNVTAIQKGNVMVADYTNAVRGSLDLADLYEDVAEFVHPELFKEE
ncbi:ABC transporter substrate-binding protein [Inediibacterium massiliense]|uniref:ABC transporter substrate-binding protein n=1 Tax=Inediibacterium massiliense TaxID=1658111 RepID=UPI0006B5D50B|nr:ABC transporter substrate-binding protein [Inediibacterium massiliense]